MKKLGLIAGGLFALLASCGIGAAIGSSSSTPSASSSPGPTVTVTAQSGPQPTTTTTVTEAAKPRHKKHHAAAGGIPGDGTYLVGSEVQPGVYKSSGHVDMGLCYADTETRGGDVMAQEVANKGAVILRVSPRAYTVKVEGCGSFTKVG